MSTNDDEMRDPLTAAESLAEKRKATRVARLVGRAPLPTVFFLAIGPVIAQESSAIFLIVNLLWVSKAIGVDGISAISSFMAFDNIGRAFGLFLALGASTQISALFGKGKESEISQVCADLLRMTFVFGAFIPAALLPGLRKCGEWLGASEHVVELGWNYMLPICSFATTTCIYLTACGLLQGEGRTLLFGLTNFICLALNGLCFDPFFLFVMKTGIAGVSIATIISEIIPGTVLLIMFYCGKFTVKLHLSDLFKKFSPHTKAALSVGVSQLISQLSVCGPSIVVRKYIGVGVSDFDAAMSAFAAAIRFRVIGMACLMGISMGFVPAASYAFAAGMYRRYIRLVLHTLWVGLVCGSVACAVTWIFPRQLGRLFSTDEAYLDYAESMIAQANAVTVVGGIPFLAQSMLASMQLGGRATIMSFMNNCVWLLVWTFTLYYSDPSSGTRVVWCYPLSNIMAILSSIPMLWGPVRHVLRMAKLEEENEQKELEDAKDDTHERPEEQTFVDEKNVEQKEKSDTDGEAHEEGKNE